MTSLDMTRIKTELPLADGSKIVLLDRLAAPPSVSDEDVERNVYRLSVDGGIQWQIDSGGGVYSRTPFTGIELTDNSALTAYRWDGTEFGVDVATGVATPRQLSK